MKVAVVIPARYASTRLPAKPLALIKGKPLLQWVIEGARKSPKISAVVVATDHLEIMELAKRCGAEAVMTDPDCPTGSDRIFQAIQSLEQQNQLFDIVINVQGDEPLISEVEVDLVLEALLEDSEAMMSTLGHPLKTEDLENKNSVKVLMNQNSDAIYFSRFPIPFSRQQFIENQCDHFILKHVGIYGFRTKFLKQFCQHPVTDLEKNESLEQLRALFMGKKIKVKKMNRVLQGVDSPEDIVKVERLL